LTANSSGGRRPRLSRDRSLILIEWWAWSPKEPCGVTTAACIDRADYNPGGDQCLIYFELN
jgi:hypothetical protein